MKNIRQTLILLATVCSIVLGSMNSTNAQAPVKVVGDRHTLVLLSDGTVFGWGACDWGELGPIAAVPQRRNWATALVPIRLPRKAIDIAAGDASSFAVLDDGTVVSWGKNLNQMLGTSSRVRLADGKDGSEGPVKVDNLSEVIKVAAGGNMAVALKKDGTVYHWGKSAETDGPTKVSELRNITQVSVGTSHAMALDSAGNVWTWGNDYYGALGRISKTFSVAQVPGLTNVVSIAAGPGVSTVVKKDGTVWVWGSNFQGQFGNGKRTDAPVQGGLANEIVTIPQPVAGVRNAVSVTSGLLGRHTIVLLEDGTLRAWGNTDWGQIGAGITADFQLNPVTPKITGVKAVFAVQNNSFAVKNDNTFWAWGTGWDGEFPLKTNVKIPKLLQLSFK